MSRLKQVIDWSIKAGILGFSVFMMDQARRTFDSGDIELGVGISIVAVVALVGFITLLYYNLKNR